MFEKSSDMHREIKIFDIEILMPKEHLLRRIDRVIVFQDIYEMTKKYHCENNGRPCCDSVIVVKTALLQHLFGIRSLRQTIKGVETDIAYRWFLHFNSDMPIPHFSTIRYAFATRFSDKPFEEIFSRILEKAVEKRMVDAKAIFIDAAHIRANANKKKHRKRRRNLPQAFMTKGSGRRLMPTEKHTARSSSWRSPENRKAQKKLRCQQQIPTADDSIRASIRLNLHIPRIRLAISTIF